MRIQLLVLMLGLLAFGCNKTPWTSVKPVPVDPSKSNPEKDLADLNDAVRGYGMTKFKKPDTLEDLVKAGLIQRLPVAPVGKKYILDDKKNSALLVDQ